MHDDVVYVEAQRLVNELVMKIDGFVRLTKMLLLIVNEVFGTGHDLGTLDSFDCLSKHHARQDRVGAEPFPNPASCGLSSQRARDRPQGHVHPFVPILPANRLPSSKCKLSIESRGNIDASGEGRGVVGPSQAQRAVL